MHRVIVLMGAVALSTNAHGQSREINPYLATVPYGYDVLSGPNAWEGEGMRGFFATIEVHGRQFEIVSTCELYGGEDWFRSAPEVSVWYGEELARFVLNGPGDENTDLRMPLIASEIIPHDFYLKTCAN